MTFPLPMNEINAGIAVSLGMVGSPAMEFVFSAPLRFAVGATANTVIAVLTNPLTDTLVIAPADDVVRWDGNTLEVGAVTTATPKTLYYDVTRIRAGVSFKQTITVAVV